MKRSPEDEVTHFYEDAVTTEHFNYVPGDTNPHDTECLDSNTSLKFDFELDAFQIESIRAVNSGNHVLVIASTSSGKSVIAYHAISKSLELDNCIAIYTSPVKSLANQKYLELREHFDDVGLLTGDISENPSARVLVMTAEVLRNQLMRRGDYATKVRHIILDEFHYLGNTSRGVVWEEIIMSSGPQNRFVCLTATLPNYAQLASWIAITTNIPVSTVIQRGRPVPLMFYGLSDGKKMQLLRQGDHPALIENLNEICETKTIGRSFPTNDAIISQVNLLMKNGHFPLLVFCLSKKKCNEIASGLTGTYDRNLELRFSALREHFKESWVDDDTRQFKELQALVSRRIGVHHSGIRPVIREIIEILFKDGDLDALVATETFSLGINAPVKTVFFTSIEKWDGVTNRLLNGSEFMQMAGRAGRRGKYGDEFGEVFVYIPKGVDSQTIRKLVESDGVSLHSKMKISTSLVLSCSLLHNDPKEFMKRSLFVYQARESLPAYEAKLHSLPPCSEDEEEKKKYLKMCRDLCPYFAKYIQPGRLVYIARYGWGVVKSKKPFQVVTLNILNEENEQIPAKSVDEGTNSFPTSSLLAIAGATISVPNVTLNIFAATIKKNPKVPLIWEQGNLPETKKVSSVIEKMDAMFPKDVGFSIIQESSDIYMREELCTKIASLTDSHFDQEIDRITQMLQAHNYMDNDGLLELKGRVACSLRCDEPVALVELLFSGFFIGLRDDELMIAVSGFIESPPNKTTFSSIRAPGIQCKIKKALEKCNLQPEAMPQLIFMCFVDTFFETRSLAKAAAKVEMSEGEGFRVLKRLKEMLLQLQEASKEMHAPEFEERFAKAIGEFGQYGSFDQSIYRSE